MITKRIIPCLDVKNGRVVKGTNFQGLSDVSDPDTAVNAEVLRLMGVRPSDPVEEVSEDDIKLMVDASEHIDSEEKELIQNIFEFDDLTAGEIATHRTDVTLLSLDESDDDWDRAIRTGRHTRYPICGESADDVVGILNTRDYFILDDRSRESVMKNAVKPAYFVPLSVKADVLFKNMKNGRGSLAVVLDEYGGMTGIVTMNDLIGRLVGDLQDEETLSEEKEIPDIEKVEDGLWNIIGNVSLDELEAKIPELLQSVHDGLYQKAYDRRASMTFTAKDFAELRGITLAQFAQFAYSKTEDELYDYAHEEAEKMVKEEMICYAIARAENLVLTDEEYEKRRAKADRFEGSGCCLFGGI